MNVEKAISTRRSIRSFNSKPVSDEVLRKVLLAGNDAPSALNNQKKAIVAVVGESAKQKLNEIVRENADEATIRRISSRCNGEFNFFYSAPALILVASSDVLYPEADCACAIENMYLRATDLGLGACWINQLSKANYPALKEFLKKAGVGEEYTVYGALAVGYTDQKLSVKDKNNRIIIVR